MTPAARDRLARALVAGVALALTGAALAGRGAYYQRDVLNYWVPQAESFVRVVTEGAWPTWNPAVGFGSPLLADSGYQVAYPATWLNLVLRPERSYTVFATLHLLLAGSGAWRLARGVGLARAAAVSVATAWTSSGPLLSFLSMNHHFAGACWMPWVLAALEAILRRPTARSALALAGALSLQVLAGSGDMVLMTAGLGALRVLALVVGPSSAEARPTRTAAALGLAAVLTLALTAVQWVPTAALASASARRALPVSTITHWSVHPLALADLLLPRLVSDLPLGPEARGLLFDGREPLVPCLYLGAAAAVLAGLGAALARRRAPAWIVLGFLGALLLALGRHAPLHGLLLALPPFRMMRYPAKFLVPAALLFSLLVGFGVDAWRSEWGRRERRRAVAAASILVAAFLLAAALAAGLGLHLAEIVPGPAASAPAAGHLLRSLLRGLAPLAGALVLVGIRLRRPGAAGRLLPALCALLALDLLVVGRGVNPLAPAALLRHRPPVVDALLGAGGEERVFVLASAGPALHRALRRGPEGWGPEASWNLGLQQLLLPPAAARWGLRGSFDGDFTGLAPPALSVLTERLHKARGSERGLRLLRAGGVGHVVSLEAEPYPGLQLVGSFPGVFDHPVRLHRVPGTLPPVALLGRVRRSAAPAAALDEPEFDPSREVVLPAWAPPLPPDAGFRGEARLVARRADRLEVETSASGPAYLVLVEAWARGWEATVDGAPTPVIPANVLLQAVLVPAGRHRVHFAYRPAPVRWGVGLTGLGLAAAALAWAVAARGQGRPPGGRLCPPAPGA